MQITISQLKAELEKGPQEAAVYTQQIHQLQSTVNSLQQQSQVLTLTLTTHPEAAEPGTNPNLNHTP